MIQNVKCIPISLLLIGKVLKRLEFMLLVYINVLYYGFVFEIFISFLTFIGFITLDHDSQKVHPLITFLNLSVYVSVIKAASKTFIFPLIDK